jgi:hypothetical protein
MQTNRLKKDSGIYGDLSKATHVFEDIYTTTDTPKNIPYRLPLDAIKRIIFYEENKNA